MQVLPGLNPNAVDNPACASSASRALQDATLSCAQTLMDLVPGLMDAIRQHMRAAAPAGISVPQMRMLIFARRHGGTSLSAVAEHLGVTLPTVSVAAQRLVDAGLLDNRPDPQDRRRSAIWLTPAGMSVVRSARRRTRADVASRLQDADVDTLQTIQSGLYALAQTLQQAGTAADTPSSDSQPQIHPSSSVVARATTAIPPSRPAPLSHP